ncbi:beta-alanine transporter-like isoform X2 [Parasteatoda tepidariorum]|uniref:beta-alanine transporter-like isoform X2 n=1 Tax=Parasteatoda tepidariorum TaxID=114398 RepID=UPI000A2C0C36|nr:beta-alanine transporter-like [Parasteatoda tepidariorum]
MLKIDSELKKVGEQGRYQHLLLWLVLLPSHLPFGMQHYSQLLSLWTPNHWCKLSRIQNQESLVYRTIRTSMVREYRNTEYFHAQCFINRTLVNLIIHEHRKTFSKRSLSRGVIEVCNHGWYYNRTWLGDTNTVITEWDLVCDRSFLPTFALILYGIGELLSLPLYFYVTYRQGRRFSFFLFMFCECLFGCMSSLAPNFGCFALLRFLLGITVPASTATPAAVAQELMGSSWKGYALQFTYLYRSLGGVLITVMVYWVRDWHNVALASSLPFFAFFLYWWVLPESPQWLLARGRFEETIRLIRTIARINRKNVTPDFIVATKRKFVLEKSLQEHKNEPKTQAEATKDLFRAQGYRKRIIVIMFSWLTSTASFLGLNYLCIELQGDVHSNLLTSALTEIAGWFCASIILKFVSRRCCYCVSCALGGVLCITMATRRRSKTNSISLFTCTKLSVSISYFVLPLWTAELLPQGTREPALVLVEIISLACPVFLPLLIYQGRTLHSLPMALIGVFQILGGLVALTLPETRTKNFLNEPTVLPIMPPCAADHWADEHNCSCCKNPHKSNPGNGKVNPAFPESPIFSLLRCQESQMSYSGRESAMSDMSNPKMTERRTSLDELKVTVL